MIHRAPAPTPARPSPETAPLPDMILVAGLPPGELVRRLVTASRTTAMGNRALAFYLHDMQSRGEHHALSFASAAHFAMARLEMGKTAAYELVSLGASLDGLPRIDAAFCEGEISWSKVKILCRVAVPETEIAWLEVGKELNCRQLAREVASSEKGRPPRKNRRGLPHLSYVVKARVDATRREILEAARRKLQDETGEFVNTPDLLTILAERFLRSAWDGDEGDSRTDVVDGLGGKSVGSRNANQGPGGLDGQATDNNGTLGNDGTDLQGDAASPAGRGPDQRRGKRRSAGLLFQVVIERCPDCHDSLLHTEEGPVCLSRGRGDMIACCEAKTREVVEGKNGNECSARIDIPTPAWMREFVLLRDGMKCVCCGGRNLLMAHHVDFRSQGGRTVPSRLCSLCADCHEMVHEGVLTVTGDARTGFTFGDSDGVPQDEALRSEGGQVTVVKSQDVNSLALDDSVCPENGAEDGCAPSNGHAGDRVGFAASRTAVAPLVTTSISRAVTFEAFPEHPERGWWLGNKGHFRWNDRRRAFEIGPDTRETLCSRPVPGADCPGDDTNAPLLSDLIGHDEAIACLRSAMRAAREIGKPLSPTLISGPPGVGKTSLSHAVARELGVRLHKLHGSAIRDPGFLAGWLAGGGKHDIFFVDELHSVPRDLCEMMYEAIDGRRLTLPVVRGAESRTVSIELEPVTLLGATTHLAEIPEALRTRFRTLPLDLLEARDLERIVTAAAPGLGVEIESGAAGDIARRAKGNPRQALSILGHSRDVGCTEEAITRQHVARALRELGIDDRGLDRTDRKVLELLVKKGRAISQRGIAMMAGLPLQTYRDVVEPYLVRAGWIEVTPRGRVAVPAPAT